MTGSHGEHVARHLQLVSTRRGADEAARLMDALGLTIEEGSARRLSGEAVDGPVCHAYQDAVLEHLGALAYSFMRVNFTLAGCTVVSPSVE